MAYSFQIKPIEKFLKSAVQLGRRQIHKISACMSNVPSRLGPNQGEEDAEAFYVCDLGVIIQKYLEWTSNLPRVKPFFAVKSNDDIIVLRILNGLGVGFDCASQCEMEKMVETVRADPQNVIFANPIKQLSHMHAALNMGVSKMVFDNESELHKIKRIYPNARLLIRLMCEAEKPLLPLGVKFGLSVQEGEVLLKIAKQLELNVVGVCFHVGTGYMDAHQLRWAIAMSHSVFEMGNRVGHHMNLLDIGGGFSGKSGTSIKKFAGVINESLNEYFPEESGVEIIAEPGRFFVTAASTLMTQIQSVRKVQSEEGGRNKFMYYINDGVFGSFHNLLSGPLDFEPKILRRSNTEDDERSECSIWGPTCAWMDKVCSNAILPEMGVGDWIYFRDMGAYRRVAACTFNGFPIPKVHHVITKEAWKTLRATFVAENIEIEQASE